MADRIMVTCSACGYDFGYVPPGWTVKVNSNEWGQCLVHTMYRTLP